MRAFRIRYAVIDEHNYVVYFQTAFAYIFTLCDVVQNFVLLCATSIQAVYCEFEYVGHGTMMRLIRAC